MIVIIDGEVMTLSEAIERYFARKEKEEETPLLKSH
jgi:hypothetical protein